MYFIIAVIDCPVLTAPLNGTFGPEIFQYDTVVNYSCNYTVKIEVLPSTPFGLTNCKVSGSTNRGANLNPTGVLKVTGC